MKPFGYGRDPLCLTACALYALNRWGLQPHTASRFLRGQFDDLLLIPCALPWVLWLQRHLGLRAQDAPPGFGEVAFHLVVWSLLFELIGPHLMRVTGDPLDVLAYAVGAILALAWWQRDWLRRMSAS